MSFTTTHNKRDVLHPGERENIINLQGMHDGNYPGGKVDQEPVSNFSEGSDVEWT